MPKTRTQMCAMSFRGGLSTRAKYAGTDYFREIGAKGGRAGRGVKKPRKSADCTVIARKSELKYYPTHEELIADLEGGA